MRERKSRGEECWCKNSGERCETIAEVGCERRNEGTVAEIREEAEMNEHQKTRTPRLRAPVGTPWETGVRRPDGRKPEAGDGAGLGSWV